MLGGVWLHDLRVANERLRFAAGSKLSLANEDDQSAARPASMLTGLADPLAFEHGFALELHADIRLVRDRKFAQAELATALLSPPAGTGLAIRFALGGGIQVGQSAALLATFTAATATVPTGWSFATNGSGDTNALESDLRLALAIGGATIGVAVPVAGGATTIMRGFMLTVTLRYAAAPQAAPTAHAANATTEPQPPAAPADETAKPSGVLGW